MTAQATYYETNPKNNIFDPSKDYWSKYVAHGFQDYTKDFRLIQFKETLPLTIQRIIEFEHSLQVHKTVLELQFHEIEQDLKYQYDKFNGNKIKLQQMFFFDYNSYHSHTHTDNKISKCCDKRYQMLFYSNGRHETKNYTVVHYLLNKTYTLIEKSPDPDGKIIIQLLKMLKLLIANNIIQSTDNLGCNNTIWDRLSWSIYRLDDSKFVPENVKETLIDLIMICLPQNALMNIEIKIGYYDTKYIKSQKIEQKRSIPCILNAVKMDIIDFTKVNKKHPLIERLLFRAIPPFKFIEPKSSSAISNSLRSFTWILGNFDTNYNSKYNRKYNLIPNDRNSFKELNLNQNFIMEFLKKETNPTINYFIHSHCQMNVLAPLVFMSYLNVAKNNMKSLLTKCLINYEYANDSLSNLIA
eukprot:21605_1